MSLPSPSAFDASPSAFASRSSLSLFGVGEPAINGFEQCLTVPLSPTSWLEVQPSFVAGSELLFEDLLEKTQWRAYRRPMFDKVVDVPRLMGHPPPDSKYSGLIEELRVLFSQRYGSEFTRVSLALYRDGRDSVAWHADVDGSASPQDLVVVVGLGARRLFHVRAKGGPKVYSVTTGEGDLVAMCGKAQHEFEHCVPKSAVTEPRIAVVFRTPPARGVALYGSTRATRHYRVSS